MLIRSALLALWQSLKPGFCPPNRDWRKSETKALSYLMIKF